MNKVFLIGNLTRDPNLRVSEGKSAMCYFGIAVSRDYLNSDGTRDTDFFNVKVFRNKAENCGKFLKKGNKVGIVGKLENRPYTDDDGSKRMVTEIIAEDVEFLTPKSQTESEPTEQTESKEATQIKLEEIDDNELPF